MITALPTAFPGLASWFDGLPVIIRRQPLLEVDVASDLAGLDRALAEGSTFQAIICTSARAASVLLARWPQRGQVAPAIWTLGGVDSHALASIAPVVTPFPGDPFDPAVAAAMVAQIVGTGVRGRVLCLIGDPDLPDVSSRLADAGLLVSAVSVYRCGLVSDVEILATLERAELLVVANPLVVEALASHGEDAFLPGWVAVGRATADSCRQTRVPLIAVADDATTPRVAQALLSVLAARFGLQPRVRV
ncbi:MAG: uroporphyrinogen-III synthase [Gemmatimonadota bacterium]